MTNSKLILRTILSKKTLLFLLFALIGGMTSETWALTARYYIVNNKGKVAFNYASTSTTLAVDPKAQGIYAENFRFYTSLADAQTDASTNGASKPNALSLGATATDGATYYVRYDAKSERVGKVGSVKYLMRARNRNGIWWYIYFDSADGNKLKMTTQLDGTNLDKYLWKFNDGGDPYDVYITSDYADASVSGGTVSVAGVSTSNKIPYVTYQTKIADGSYNQSATSDFTMQSFFFTQGNDSSPYSYNNNWSSIWSNSVQLVGAYNGINYNYRVGANSNSNSGFENTMPYYLCANGNPNASGAMSNGYQWHCFRSWRGEDPNSTNISQIQLLPDFAIYHIVNKSGDVAIVKIDESPADALDVPSSIKSPYITSDANYKFFNTKEAAAAYSAATTDGERTAAAASAITLYSQVTGGTVYVGYHYDPSTKPSSLPTLDGTLWYQIINRYNNQDNYLYSRLNNNGKPENSSICNSATHMTGSLTDDYHLWKFTGNDPYAIHISNKWMNENKGNGSELYVKASESIAQGWFRSMAGYYTTIGRPMMMLTYNETYYNMAIVSTDMEYNGYEYLYFFGTNGTDGSNNVQWMRNQNTTSDIYKSDRVPAQLRFVEARIKPFEFKVKTPSGSFVTHSEDYDIDTDPFALPEDLERKYISSISFYSDEEFTNEITGGTSVAKWEDAAADCILGENGYIIYVKYTVDTANMPFKVSTNEETNWYRMTAKVGDVTAPTHLSNNQLVAGLDGTYSFDYIYAFYGDPYELMIKNRGAGDNYYLGVPTGSALATDISPQAAGNTVKWEIIPDSPDGKFQLRAQGTFDNPRYAGYQSGAAKYMNASPMELAAVALPSNTYTYHIIDNTGREAISGSAEQQMYTTISYENLPAAIRSQYIEGETLTGYLTATETSSPVSDGRKAYRLTNPVSETPTTAADIYIRYTSSHLMEKFMHLRGARAFNVTVNNQSNKYAYNNSGAIGYDDNASNKTEKNHLWYFTGQDPYAVKVQNVGDKNIFLTHNGTTDTSKSLGADGNSKVYFILMTTNPGDSNSDGIDDYDEITLTAATEADINETHYSNTMRVLSSDLATTYYIIDKSKHLIVGPIDGETQDLQVPSAWSSPLVSQYHFYTEDDFDIATGEYTLKGGATELQSPAEAPDGKIYCTYDVGNSIDIDTTDDGNRNSRTYMLRFLNGEMFNQEDGSDGVMTTQRKAMYPYSNGDACLYVYGSERWDLQLSSGATTRSRWLWHVVSPTADPYHVYIMSYQAQASSHNYLRTYAETFGGSQHVITGVTTLNDDASAYPRTEYMIVGSAGHTRLVTVDNINDGSTTERRTVNSFEQYWKNNPTAYNILENAGLSVGEQPVDYNLSDTQKAELNAIGWHNYDAMANAAPWSSNPRATKSYSKGNHWFQTVSMGNGEFAFEEVSLTPQVILLDQHGWEIMRRPFDAEQLKVYDSPMVEKYHWWTSGSKKPGYHIFTVSNAATTEDGSAEYTSTSLASYPDFAYNASKTGNVKDSSNRLIDLYVTYDVKKEYNESYIGAATESATQASAFMVGQNNQWLTTNGSGITQSAAPASYDAITDSYLWYLQPNFNIDREMGYRYLGESGAQEAALSQAETEANNYSEGRNGFDPYNLQLRNAANGLYLQADYTAATLGAGIWTGGSSPSIGFKTSGHGTTAFNSIGYDQSTVNITNETFMAVQDASGNLRLMPRFDHTRVINGLSTTATFTSTATATQTTILAKPTTYTYHVINKNGRETLTYTDKYMAGVAYTPSLPSHLKAYGATNFRYFPLSEFDSESLKNSVFRMVNPSAASYTNLPTFGSVGNIYVLYDIDNDAITGKGFDGTKMYNMKLRADNTPTDYYMTYNKDDGSISATATSLTSDQTKLQQNIWRITTNNNDPYQASLYNFRNPSIAVGVNSYGTAPAADIDKTYNTFIITNWNSANNKFELLGINSGTADNDYAYFTYSEGPKVIRDGGRQHNDTEAENLVGFTLEPVTLSFTYKLYDLSGNLTLQGSVSDVSDLTPSLPEFMRSPLVYDENYLYWQDEARFNPLKTLSETENNIVYVSYTPLSPEEASLKLDGSQHYTFHTKLNNTTLAMGNSGRVNLQLKDAERFIPKRENYYEHTLLGREINGQFDPYDVAIYSPFQDRYWQSGNIHLTTADRRDDINCNTASITSRFMILHGATDSGVDYIQIAQKRMNGSTHYPDLTGTVKYVYHNGTQFSTGQGTTETSYTHNGGEDHQLHVFQPTKRYHVLNMQGKEAVSAVEARLVIPDVTTPLVPDVIKSPIVKTFHYYDASAFDVSGDGVYTLRGGATELEKLSEATTDDIFVVYTNADLDKSYALDGSIAYNIIFAPDAFTQDDITETLNSYFGYDAGLTYRGVGDSSTLESFKFQVTGSYYADPSSGAMASRYIVVPDEAAKTTAIAAHAESGNDNSRWDPKYLIEADLTDSQKQDNHYLWCFTGTDPYALKIHNMTDPDKYIYRNGDAGGYTVGLTHGTTTNELRSTYMLVGRGTGDATRFNIMSSGPCTAGIAPYSYQYIGRSYHSNVHRTTRRGVVLQGFHEWGWNYTYNEALVTVKLVPQLEGYVTYIVKNKLGNEAIRMRVKQSIGIRPIIPDAIKSPYAKNFKYWSDAACTAEKTLTSSEANIYVTYDADETALDEDAIDLTGTDSYNLWVNGMYLYNSNDNLVADKAPSRYDDTVHEWFLKGNSSSNIDPYDIRLQSKKTLTKYIELASYNNTSETNTVALVADNGSNDVQSFILMKGQPHRWELLAATKDKTIVSSNNRLSYLGYIINTQILGVGSDDENPVYQSGMNQVQVMLRPPLSGVTYHIMNLSGTEAIRYTVAASKGDDLEVPEQIRSPFATEWKFWSDEECTAVLTKVPDAYADIYVTYTYDDETASQMPLDGQRFYNMQVGGVYISEDDGAIRVLPDETLSTGDANITANLWAFNGTTTAGIDPYNIRLVNKAYPDVYAGAPMNWGIDTETQMQMSDGETDYFRSSFVLVGSSASGPYELVAASGVNITDNLLANVNYHDSDHINLNRDDSYQHGNSALAITMTSPVNKYLYQVFNRSGNLAIQAWGDGVAGAAPVIPDVIKSPLVSTFYYDIETLPYTNGVDAVKVTYDFDSDKLTSPNLLGTKVYNLKFKGDQFVVTSTGSDVTLQSSNTETLGTPLTDNAIWKPTGKFGSVDDIDPYDITLKHTNNKVLEASSINNENNNIALAESGTYDKFILLEGIDGRYELMAATGSAIGSVYGVEGYDKYAYLAITDQNEVKLARGDAYSRGKTAIQVDLIGFQSTFRYIIVNNDMYKAIIYDVKQEGGDPVEIPNGLRSPLLDLSEYEYYTAGAFTNSATATYEYQDNDLTSVPLVFADDATKASNKLTTLPYSDTTIYVRYSYSQKSGGLDITGLTKYQIKNEDATNEYLLSANTNATNHSVSNNTNPTTNRTNNNFLWRLKGEDPYNIKITNVARDEYDEVLLSNELWYQQANGNYTSRDQGFEMRTDDYKSNTTTKGRYRANRFAILGHEDGNYRLMAIAPFFWDTDYYELSDAQKESGVIAANQRQERYYTLDNRWAIYRHNRVNNTNLLDMNIETGMSIQFVPLTNHNYRFHLTTKIDGRHLVVEKPNTMARDLFQMPEELMRKYCDYTVKYYVDQDDDANTQLPVTKDAVTKVEKTIDLSSNRELYPFFQAIDNMSEAAKANQWVDIYIDYHARQHYKTDANDNYIQENGVYVIDPEGMPFNVMGWNQSTVHMLLNNTGGYTDYLFQINNYDNLNEQLGTFNLHRYNYLYFLVLKTDNDYTNSNGQYFLRREDSGRISWLNNDYTIHKDNTKNYKEYNYSRCAETYRDNDHSVFEEKKWLFCFAGDPYDLYIFNANSTVEETYNQLTEQKELVKVHRNHLVNYTTLTNSTGTTTEYAVNTPSYDYDGTTFYRWGLAEGQGADSDETFSFITSEFTDPVDPSTNYTSPTTPNIENKPLYWRMDKSKVENIQQVMLQERDVDNTTLDYNLQVLPYEPTKYEDVRFVIKRDDQIDNDGTTNTYLGKYPDAFTPLVNPTPEQASARAAESQERSRFIDNLSSGYVRMYSSVSDRLFVKGDHITLADLPVEIRRQFCDYNMYSDDYRTEGEIASLPYCPIRGEVQRDGEGNIVYNDQGKAMYNFYAVNPETGAVIMVGSPGNQTPQGAPPQTIYIKYTVTTDKFLKKRPTVAEVEDMIANNDHVYFMDFADPNLLKGEEIAYNNGHHAYFSPDATFKDLIGSLHGDVQAEKMKWNGSTFVYDTDQPFNYCQYKSTSNRMETVPENLKWYFVGDPYKLQVYNTQYVLLNNEPEGNLCRFDPTETSFQFVVDCVHFRAPDPSFIDERKTLIYTDSEGNPVEIDNPNYGKPYYTDFYWEVVPAATDDPDAFALRFRDDNQILGYRDVFYYLAHDGIKRTYREAQSDNPKAYGINLSYDPENALTMKGKYKGYHAANDENCVIRLMHPTKIYFSAYKETYSGDPVVLEELSEYYGLGETIKEVPRHLQRKFVAYDNLQYQKNGTTTWYDGTFPFTLEKASAFNLENCAITDPIHTKANGWVFKDTDSDGDPTKCRASFKFRVTYELEDITKDGVHLFTTPAEFSNPSVQPQWLDVTVGGNHWLFYDKTRVDNDKDSPTFREENDTLHIISYPTTSGVGMTKTGWDIGIKGLHWAFIGDPYKFTIINRRRWEDNGQPRTAGTDKNFWLGTGYGQASGETGNPWYNYTRLGDTDANRVYGENGSGGNEANGNTLWGLVMCKTGGDSDYFIRTSSQKITKVSDLVGDYGHNDSRNMTNDYLRMVYKDFTNLNGSANPAKSSFTLETFNLETLTKDIAKADIRTAVAEDEDHANNDCFDANVRIYNTNGELKASLKHVELKYDDVFKSIPATIKRYGCNYIECYQISYDGFNTTDLATESGKNSKRTAINTLLQSLGNFTGDNKIGTLTEFTQDGVGNLNAAKMIRDENTRKYYEIAYVYTVEDDIAKYFTSEENASQNDYYWTNASYQWDQIYRGSNVRVVSYESVFDHYEYNADGKIVNEVYKQVEKVEYKSGEQISTPAYGWLNSHDGYSQAYGDELTQQEDNDQKWAFVGDPYDFELKNYSQYLVNNNSALYYNESTGINASNVEKSHWAIVQGLQKTAIVNGATRNVYTDASGNTVYEATTNGVANTPVYVYYLALIDDDEMSSTYGTAIQFVSFDRATDSADLPKEEQYLKLQGGVLDNDPTGMFYNEETRKVHPFYLADLLSYANWVVYHLVMAHQYSLDYTDAGLTDNQKLAIDNHLVEWLKYQYPSYMTTTTTTVEATDYTKATNTIKGEFITGGADFIPEEGTTIRSKLTSAAKTAIADKLRKGTLRDVVADEVPDYSVNNVGIGNTLTVPWYMQRQFTKYKLYQRDVLRSEISDRIVYEEDGVTPKTFIDENGVEQIAKEIDWISVTTDPSKSGYEMVVSQNGHEITKLNSSHKNRMVIIDVVYDVDDTKFSFANDGRTSTDWYQLMTDDENDGLVNFSYKDGVGASRDCSVNYTNNYLWAPEGDSYGFVLRSRYATVNGTGWDNVALTTANTTYDKESTYALTHSTSYNKKNIHYSSVNQNHNAIYEMYVGRNDYSFLMHPTSNSIDNADEAYKGFYMTHNTSTHEAELQYSSSTDAKNSKESNWRLMVTPEQLLPYFDNAGYVGGLKPSVAKTMSNSTLYNTLQNYRDNYRADLDIIDFATIDRARQLVYSGTFDGEGLPAKFESTNLVPLEKGYYRLKAVSTQALTHDGTAVNGIMGPRYISGYRHLSELKGYNAGNTALTTDSVRHLHFVETDEENTTINTWGALTTAVNALPTGTKKGIREIINHPAMRGNNEIPAVEYDPSSIFYVVPTGDSYDRYTMETQGMKVNATAGAGDAGIIKLDDAATSFRFNDIGGANITIHTMATESAASADIANNLKTNYLAIDPSHRYRVTVNTNNELSEIGDDLDKWTKDGAEYAIHNTQWLLQPVGAQTEWPYNEMPLRLKVNQGGGGDNNYYSTLYVPFDTRLSSTIDAAFTSIKNDPVPTSVQLIALSRLNNMGNPQFIPAAWPVVIRTSNPKSGIGCKYVTLDLPNANPTVIADNQQRIRLYGQYLERMMSNDSIDNTIQTQTGETPSFTNGRHVMVFGRPFVESGDKSSIAGAATYYEYKDAAVGFYTNENWMRGHEDWSDATDVTVNLSTAHLATARSATYQQRSNKYVYSNKVFYVYDYTPGGGSKPFFTVTFSDEDEEEEDHPIDEDTTNRSGEPWPCDVFDLMGRRVATDETPSTLLRNHPNLPAGVYIFGGRKVIVK